MPEGPVTVKEVEADIRVASHSGHSDELRKDFESLQHMSSDQRELIFSGLSNPDLTAVNKLLGNCVLSTGTKTAPLETHSPIGVARNGSVVAAEGGARVVAEKGSTVLCTADAHADAESGSEVIAAKGADVHAETASIVMAREGSHVSAGKGSIVLAEDGSTVVENLGAIVKDASTGKGNDAKLIASLDTVYDMAKNKTTFANDINSQNYLDVLEQSIKNKAYPKGEWSKLKDALGVIADSELNGAKNQDQAAIDMALRLIQLRKAIEFNQFTN